MIKEFWGALGARERKSLLAVAVGVVALFAAAGWWVLRPDYRVVFSDLSQGDAAVLVAELERQKQPYRLDDNGTTILVERDQVHKTRIKLMGRELPLHGAVGFELFNHSDFGMTEFVQKVNYQRALQGELTRTILALAEIQDARVHLVLPEDGLFKRERGQAKASITVTQRPGRSLQAQQVLGIQRLVAAAVPGIAAQDVTIVDQRGVALTRAADTAEAYGGAAAPAGQLDLKRETETLLARKAAGVLDRAFGRGQALVSVDVLLDRDLVRTTTEDVLGAAGNGGNGASSGNGGNAAGTGIITREREINQDTAAPLDRAEPGRRGSTQREVDYAVGRRVEHIVSSPGGVRRLQVVAVVSQPLTPERIEPVRELLAAAVGASKERGDTVVVYSMDAAALRGGSGAVGGNSAASAANAGMSATGEGGAANAGEADLAASHAGVPALAKAGAPGTTTAPEAARARPGYLPDLDVPDGEIVLLVGGMVLATIVLLGTVLRLRARPAGPPRLDDAQREARLAEVRRWLASPAEAALAYPPPGPAAVARTAGATAPAATAATGIRSGSAGSTLAFGTAGQALASDRGGAA